MKEETYNTNIRKRLDSNKHRRIEISKFLKKDDNTYDYAVIQTIYCDKIHEIEYEEDSIKIRYSNNNISGYIVSTYIITEDIDYIKIDVQ